MFPWNLFPFNNEMKNIFQHMKPDEIEKYVQDAMKKMFPAHLEGMMNPQQLWKNLEPMTQRTEHDSNKRTLDASIFETHDHVFVRIPIEEEEWINQIRIYHTSNRFIVEHIPEIDDNYSIILPAIVKKKGAVARYKDKMLEIKLVKQIDMQFSEIDVSEVP